MPFLHTLKGKNSACHTLAMANAAFAAYFDFKKAFACIDDADAGSHVGRGDAAGGGRGGGRERPQIPVSPVPSAMVCGEQRRARSGYGRTRHEPDMLIGQELSDL